MASPGTYCDEHLALVEQLRVKLATAALGGPERARERHVSRGKLLPRDRVDGCWIRAARSWSWRRWPPTGCTTTSAPARA